MTKHYFEIDCHKPGDKGFKKLNAKTGMEDIRAKPIPTESSFAQRLQKLFSKAKGKSND